MTDKELLELREEVAKLLGRVAVLEQRTVPMVQIGQRVPPIYDPYVSKDPWKPQHEVTCSPDTTTRVTPTAKYMAKQEVKG